MYVVKPKKKKKLQKQKTCAIAKKRIHKNVFLEAFLYS